MGDSAIYCRYTVTTDAVCILESYNVSKIEYKVSKMARESLSQTISYWSQGMLLLAGWVEIRREKMVMLSISMVNKSLLLLQYQQKIQRNKTEIYFSQKGGEHYD